MKKMIVIVALFGLIASAALSGCKPQESQTTPPAPSTNAPAAPSTNAPAQ